MGEVRYCSAIQISLSLSVSIEPPFIVPRADRSYGMSRSLAEGPVKGKEVPETPTVNLAARLRCFLLTHCGLDEWQRCCL